MSERNRYDLRRGVIHRADAMSIYPEIPDGSVRLVISDGPYAMRKADWDMMSLDDLVDFYRPHVEAWTQKCMPSASVYIWGTSEGWARLDPLMREHGWTFRTLIVWYKPNHQAQLQSIDGARQWDDMIEVCGFYQRNEWDLDSSVASAGQHIAYVAGRDDKNWIRHWLNEEWDESGLKRKDIDRALGTNGMAGHYLGASQWSLPTIEAYQKIAAYAREHGAPRERPYLVHPSCWPQTGVDPLLATFDHLQTSYDMLLENYNHLREEYESKRVPFQKLLGVTNLWEHGVLVSSERLRSPDGVALHLTQKPLVFFERMILASTRPGELVLEPFGGTCRSAVFIERCHESDARRYIVIEIDGDGRDYIENVLPSLQLSPPPNPKVKNQLNLGW